MMDTSEVRLKNGHVKLDTFLRFSCISVRHDLDDGHFLGFFK
jgi:hypothetical protein